MANHSYIRISNPGVMMQPLIRDDSRYALLPVFRPSEVTGWVVYDSESGEILNPEEEPFKTYASARNWINRERPD